MTTELLLTTLFGLALLDSTSFGTLGVPVFLTSARTAAHLVLLYLGTITLFYFAVGVLLLVGADSAWPALAEMMGNAFDAATWAWIQIGVGIVLVIVSFVIDPKYRKSAPKRNWKPRDSSAKAMLLLALGAGTVEAATMVPYLAAIALLAQSGMRTGEQVGVLAGYSLVMVFPALVILELAHLGGRWFGPWLDRIGVWVEKNAEVMVAWAVGIVGVLLILDSVPRLVGALAGSS